MKDWNGKDIEVCFNERGNIATLHPDENLIKGKDIKWPPTELAIKNKSSDSPLSEDEHFSNANWKLGHFCQLQSISNVSALVWSAFGTVMKAKKEILEDWTSELFKQLKINDATAEDTQIFLWRKLPPCETLTVPNFELDVILSTRNCILFFITSWSDKQSSAFKQEIRQKLTALSEFLKSESRFNLLRNKFYGIVGIGYHDDILDGIDLPYECCTFSANWHQLCALKNHPYALELQRYYKWRENYSYITNGKEAKIADTALIA